MSSFCTLSLLFQATDKLLLTDLIKNACLMTVTTSLTLQNTVFKM